MKLAKRRGTVAARLAGGEKDCWGVRECAVAVSKREALENKYRVASVASVASASTAPSFPMLPFSILISLLFLDSKNSDSFLVAFEASSKCVNSTAQALPLPAYPSLPCVPEESKGKPSFPPRLNPLPNPDRLEPETLPLPPLLQDTPRKPNLVSRPRPVRPPPQLRRPRKPPLSPPLPMFLPFPPARRPPRRHHKLIHVRMLKRDRCDGARRPGLGKRKGENRGREEDGRIVPMAMGGEEVWRGSEEEAEEVGVG